MADIKRDAWDNFITSMDFESDTSNFKYEFGVMTKKYGQAYIEFCKAAWFANDGVMTEEEFMKMNGNMPRSFFDKTVNNGK
jgi:hypothetical protein